MKHVQTCFSAREDRESCFHHCRSPLSVVQACSCARKTRFNLRGGAVEHLQACLLPEKIEKAVSNAVEAL